MRLFRHSASVRRRARPRPYRFDVTLLILRTLVETVGTSASVAIFKDRRSWHRTSHLRSPPSMRRARPCKPPSSGWLNAFAMPAMRSWRRVQLGDVLRLDIRRLAVAADGHYQMAGVYNRGRGLFARESLRGADTSYKQLHRI